MFSIIIATKNSSKMLKRCLDSILRQTFSAYEIIIQDCISDDGTLALIDQYSKITKINCVSESDNGIYDGLNRAIKRAKNSYICFLHSDDFWPDNYLEKLAEVTNGKDLLITGTIRFNDDTGTFTEIHPVINRSMYFGLGFFHPAAIVKAELFRKYGLFNTDYKIASDTDWLIKLTKVNIAIALVNVNYYMYDGGISSKRFYLSKQEFSKVLFENGIIKHPKINYFMNIIKSKVRVKFIKKMMLQCYFLSLFLFNFFYRAIPLNSIRKMYLTAFGNNIGRNTFISRKIKFLHYCNLTIGSNCVIGSELLLDSRKGIAIGNNVNISNNSYIYTLGHNTNSPFLEGKGAGVKIEDDVFIFSNVIINPGCTIGQNSIVKPGAVIETNFEANSVIGGTPAVVTRKRTYESLYKHKYNYFFRP